MSFPSHDQPPAHPSASAGFNEAYYLATYPDVAAAVRAGTFASGYEHFSACGQKEGRLGTASSAALLRATVARNLDAAAAGRLFAREASWPTQPVAAPASCPPGDLERFFNSRREGRGIWKWRHYFDLYERHFARFRGREVHVLEVGVYSGGSLEMWREYFGPRAHIYGVDIEPDCQAYAEGPVKIFTGDQTDRDFWRRFRAEVPALDIVIDDGGHLYEQQRTTLEELLPHLAPGGVYWCEDIHGEDHSFGAYAASLAGMLHAGEVTGWPNDPDRRLVCATSPFQAAVNSVSFYPQVVAIEKHPAPVGEFVAPKHGTQWQPFLP